MTGRETMTGSSKVGFMDRRFIHKAADDGQDEVALAQLATQRASSADVRSFAQKLVTDHTQVNSELTTLAGQKNVKLDADDNKDRVYRRLSRASGAEFDEEFVEQMIDDHEKTIKMFEKASSDAKDPDIRSFASKHLGHLKEHLSQAQQLRSSLMPTGRENDTSGRASTTSPSTGVGTKAPGSDRSGDYTRPNPSSSPPTSTTPRNK
jgi:putative membrane protein